eukprot:XP_008185088.1 PREDICTED: structural maintenance of chromosomes protein 6-like [Acyrthosiphon pisum]
MNSKSKLNQKFSQMDSQYINEDWYNGSIKSITLQNFMCHENFHLSLNPRINFISGLNGSGKSAIQTALVIGFGANAITTSRGVSLKSFIKYNQLNATISISIANSGEGNGDCGPYKPEVYGKQITIVRQINETSNSFTILNENNKVVEKSRKELNNLTLHFNILVDNPICIMNQTMVKTFHKNAKPNEKYDLFYTAISANLLNEKIEETKSVATKHSEKLENIKSFLVQCLKEYAWFVTYQLETTYKNHLNQIESLQGILSENTDKINILEQNIKANSETLMVKKNELTNIENSRSHYHMVSMQTKKELLHKNNELDSVKQSVKKYDSALMLLNSNRKDLEKLIEVERQKGNTNTLAQYKEMLARYEQNCSEAEAAWKTNMEHEQALRNTVDELKESVRNLKNNEVTPLQIKIGELDRTIRSMSQQEDRINVYGNWMPKLVKAIEIAFSQNKFIKKPIGPIGAYIKVNNDKWIFAIENFLGRGTLRIFLVDNFTDNKVLQSIMDRIITGNIKQPTVITSKFFDKVHNITATETQNNLFRMLNFTSPIVANCLIDSEHIETIILTLDGTQVYPSPSYRVYSLQNETAPTLLQSDVSVAVNNLKREKKELEVKINNINREFENLERSKVEKQQQFDKAQSESRLLKAKYDEYSKKINELKAKCEEEQEDRLGTLTEEINDFQKEIDVLHERLREVTSFNEKTDLEREKNDLEKLIKDAELFGKKIEVSRNEEDIKRDIEEINHKKELLQMEIDKRGENILVLTDEFKKKKEKYIKHSVLHKEIEDIYKANEKSIDLSAIALKHYIDQYRLKVIEDFDMILGLGKIKGKLEIDRHKQSLEISMFDNISTSCASGGERTFATDALILALWNNIQLPFYSIDEYDVYMDDVTRLATNKLLMMAVERRKNQFIFITPQDISHIQSADNIKVVKLKDPIKDLKRS